MCIRDRDTCCDSFEERKDGNSYSNTMKEASPKSEIDCKATECMYNEQCHCQDVYKRQEFGATTGRPRRMGWFDCVASKYGCRMQGTTDVAFTVLDVLGYLEEIPVCVGYEINGEITTDFPPTHYLEKAKPVLKKLPGWNCDIRGIKKYEELPENCRKYIEFVEQEIGYPITMVSNGPGREDIIYRCLLYTS